VVQILINLKGFWATWFLHKMRYKGFPDSIVYVAADGICLGSADNPVFFDIGSF